MNFLLLITPLSLTWERVGICWGWLKVCGTYKLDERHYVLLDEFEDGPGSAVVMDDSAEL